MDQKQKEQPPLAARVPFNPRLFIVLSLLVVAAVLLLVQLDVWQPPVVGGPDLTPQRFVDFSKRSPVSTDLRPPQESSQPALRMAVAPVLSPEASIKEYEALVEYLSAKLEREPVLLQRKTYAETNDLVRYGRCDLALVCTYSFVRGEREFGMKTLVIPVVNGATVYHSLILVSAANRADSLLDLRGQRFASADIISTSGWLYPALWLKERGIDANGFFSEHLLVGSHDRSIRAVASGYADAAAVHSLVYERIVEENPEISKKIRIIQKSPAYGMPPVVVPAEIDPLLRDELASTFLSMHRDSDGRGVLSKLGIDRFVVPEDGLYDDLRSAVNVWESHQ